MKRQALTVTLPAIFSASVVLGVATWQWPLRWLLSGAPILTFFILLGAANGYRILEVVPLWTLFSTLHLAYAVSATSWLLYGVFTIIMYPTIFFTCLFQFDAVARLCRRTLRKLLSELQFVKDTIALFEIPALEIDVDVDGLMVVRGLTISWSTLTVIAHGIEVGIKMADDIELAIATEIVVISLFRGVEVGECYANVKGTASEMTFVELEELDKDEDGDALMIEDTPLLQAANVKGDRTARPRMIKMKSQMTRGVDLQDSEAKAGLKSMRTLSPEDKSARDVYDETMRWIRDTNAIEQCRKDVRHEEGLVDAPKEELRAAICSKMQVKPTVPHPPKRSIKVTTLQHLSRPRTRTLLHRMPMLLRFILNPIAYFHPVSISAITVGGSGRWVSYLLQKHIFKDYSKDNRELRSLEKRILSWLADANFVLELADITGVASVPFLTTYDILAVLKFSDIAAYRTLESGTEMEEVIRLGGGDASFTVPSYLLPHHEHLLPPKSTLKDERKLEKEMEDTESKPREAQVERELEQAQKDETNVKISTHVQLPACFSQELLNFIAALVKATKVVELEKEPGAMESKLSGIKEFGHALSKGMKDTMKKTVVDGIVSDKWIAKMVGKVTRLLEEAQGDVGYSGDIPVKLEVYRLPDGHPELSKILP